MSSSNEPPGGPAGPSGKRRPPTIDLKATEVASEPAAAAQAAEGDAPTADSASAGPEAPRRHPAIAWLPADLPWPLIAAGAGGGAALILAVLALAGVFSNRDDGLVAVDTRLARVEQQLRDLGADLGAKPSTPAAGDTKAVDELTARVARLEKTAATPKSPVADAALANRIATMEGELKALGERIGVLGRRNDEIAAIAGEARTRAEAAAAAVGELKQAPAPAAPAATPAEIVALTARVAALERAAKAMEAQLGARASDSGSDRSLRLVVVANTLVAAVERGAPFMTELGAAKAAAPDPKALAPLEPFAKSGVPGVNTLARALAALVPALAKEVGPSPRERGGILDRLKANAEKIVRVRPIDEASGDDPAAVVRRIELRAGEGNLAGAMAEIAKLPEPARDLTREWVAKVEARNAAIEAGRRFAAGALASLGKPSL